MERHYTILMDRTRRPALRSRAVGGAFALQPDFAERPGAEPPSPAIHRERLTLAELQELALEPEFVAAAEVMRTRLHAPVREEAGRWRDRRDPSERGAWGIAAVGADRSALTGAGVTVAVLDTGIDRTHPAFRGVELVERDFSGLGGDDHDGHGTHCAGTFFGRDVDSMRIGVAPGVPRALIGKIVGAEGGTSDMLVRGLHWAFEHSARVVLMSVGLDFAATAAQRAEEGWPAPLATAVALEAYRDNISLLEQLLHMLRLQEPFTGGAIVVTAAGDDRRQGVEGDYVLTASPPASADRVVPVGALDPADGGGYRVSSFSNCGVAIVAPGRAILSAAAGGGLATLSGTCVAAPHVAGVAALWWEAVRRSDLPANATLVRGKLMASAESRGFSRAVHPAERGAGRVSAPLQEEGRRPADHPSETRSIPDLAVVGGGLRGLAGIGLPAAAADGRAGLAESPTRRFLC